MTHLSLRGDLRKNVIGGPGLEQSPSQVSVKGDIYEHLQCVRHFANTMHGSYH